MTTQEQHDPRMIRARAALITAHPFFGTLALQLRLVCDPTCKTMWVDGKRLGYSPRFLDRISAAETEGVIAHEIMHCAYRHHTRRNNRAPKMWNAAGDYAINRDLLLGGFTLPEKRLYDPRFDGHGAEAIYRALLVERENKRAAAEADRKNRDWQKPEDNDSGDKSDASENKSDKSDDQERDGDKSDAKPDTSPEGDDQNDDRENGGECDARPDAPESESETPAGDDPSDASDDQESDEESDASGGGPESDASDESDPDADPESDASDAGEGDDTSDDQDNTSGDPDALGDDPADDQWGDDLDEHDPGDCGEVRDAAPESAGENGEEDAEWDVKVRQAANIASKAHGAGNEPAYLKSVIGDLRRVKTSWRDVFRQFVDPSSRKDYSWARTNRRFTSRGMHLPGLVSDGVNHVGIAIDVSGSIDSNMLTKFKSEAQAALDDGAVDRFTVIYVNTYVTRVDEYQAGDELNFIDRGGGSTRFSPAFKWFNENEPDISALVYFTDLDCLDYGPEPSFPVLWAAWGNPTLLAEYKKRVPFGQCVEIDD